MNYAVPSFIWKIFGQLGVDKVTNNILDKIGVKLDGDQLYVGYQKIYDQTVGKTDDWEKEQEKQWNKGRGR